MLSKQFRLNLRKETDFFLHCKKLHSPYFSIFYQVSDSFSATVIVSKKTQNLATARNALKRKFKNALVTLLDQLLPLHVKMAIVAKNQATHISVEELAQQITANVQKIRI